MGVKEQIQIQMGWKDYICWKVDMSESKGTAVGTYGNVDMKTRR